MSFADELDDFFADGKELIVKEPLKFKQKLGIGEKAFASLRAKESMSDFAKATAVGGTASTVVGSSAVAATFFAPTGFLASLGVGAAAVTPIGWVMAAGVASFGGYMAVSHILGKSKDSNLIVVPKYINTPMDVIAVALVELMLPVSLRIASADGKLGAPERAAVLDHFCEQWGYGPGFINRLTDEYESQLDGVSYSRLAESLHEYCSTSKDCDPSTITNEFVAHLTKIVEADGEVTENEERELQELTDLLKYEEESSFFRKTGDIASEKLSGGMKASGEALSSLVDVSSKLLDEGIQRAPGMAASAKEAAADGFVTTLKYGDEAASTVAAHTTKLWDEGKKRAPDLADSAKETAAKGLEVGAKYGSEAAKSAESLGKSLWKKFKTRLDESN